MIKKAVKIIVPILALLMMLSMASCVKACVISPSTKTPITAISVSISGFDANTVKYVVHNNIEYLLYFKWWGALAIYKGTYSYTNLPSTPFATVSFVDIACGTYNIATNVGSYTFYEVWTLSNGATFVGFDHPVISTGDLLGLFGVTTNPGWTAASTHITVAGTGASAGQVIDLATPNIYTNPWTGYWLTP